MHLDIIIIEILEEDNINEYFFQLPYLDYNNLKDKKIYIPQYPEGNKLNYSEGEILNINRYTMTYNASTKEGLSGSPIFLNNTTRVLGIHKEGNKSENENYGSFIYPIINVVNNKIIYYKDKYEGEYVNDKFEGKGKYIYDEYDEYYIGEWKNGLRNGKGRQYYENENIIYEGDWVNDKREGNGKYVFENGEYYVGEFKNGLRNGKGQLYYKNGNIKYEGDWVIYENGEYYIGECKDDLSNGKGQLYYKN